MYFDVSKSLPWLPLQIQRYKIEISILLVFLLIGCLITQVHHCIAKRSFCKSLTDMQNLLVSTDRARAPEWVSQVSEILFFAFYGSKDRAIKPFGYCLGSNLASLEISVARAIKSQCGKSLHLWPKISQNSRNGLKWPICSPLNFR